MPRTPLPWLLVALLLGACGSSDIAESGPNPPVILCHKVYSPSGFTLQFALDADSASELEGATVSLCRDDGRCYAEVLHAPDAEAGWTCGEEYATFGCGVGQYDETLLVGAQVDINYDPEGRPLVDGDVWRGELTDAQGRVLLRYEQAVEYAAICRNGPAKCGIAYQASACVSDGVGVCPPPMPENPYAC